ncbi:hypothetical protein G9444_0781 [Rhodococcus erythropolis]|uniref:Uncharacterized protein n=1 Tax=Rhodococcus erythropolis TaxID=1833 RepID=A0A6G9CLX1_RHOER|nr:hypothetical protein [Rhodococcus erythropolis]QIP38025.1 hypothetical protein G9444_0781 [Rhodococcus erythropolis]
METPQTTTIARPADVPEGYIHHSELAGRGWTRELIRDHLATVDQVRTASIRSQQVSPRWFSLAAVEQLEGSELREHFAEVEAKAAAQAKRDAAAAKRRATLAAKAAAAADLDRSIARDAGFPEHSAWLEAIKPKLLKAAAALPIWVQTTGGAFSVLAPAGAAVGDVITVSLRDGGEQQREVTGVTRVGARGGQLWVLLATEDAARAADRREAAARAAEQRERANRERAEREAIERAEREAKAEVAREKARAEAEAARARDAALAEEATAVYTAERERVDALTVAEVATELSAALLDRVTTLLKGVDTPDGLVDALHARVVQLSLELSEEERRTGAAALAAEQQLGRSCRRARVLLTNPSAVQTAKQLLVKLRAGNLDRTVTDLRKRVDARFIDVGGWVVLADAAQCEVGERLTVDKARGSSTIVPRTVYPLGEHGGIELALIDEWDDQR